MAQRPIALVTGASRTIGIGASIALALAESGWDVATTLELMADVRRTTLLGRVGIPQDCANLVRFLCSKEGGWINAQLLYSNGGIQ